MDILTHTLSGAAIGTVLASYSHQTGLRKPLGIISIAAFGAALPDFDAISLWSHFDSTLGRLFHLQHAGKDIYSDKFWYSHHGFLHSLLASLIIATLVGILLFIREHQFKKPFVRPLLEKFKNKQLYYWAFVLGFICHLFEDMPTPGGSWGGVNFFFPSNHYTGGTGEIWWWNNYDIFLIVLSVIFLNLVVLMVRKSLSPKTKHLALFIFILGVSLSLHQIKTRGYNFNYHGSVAYQQCEQKSLEIQEKILGKTVYHIMRKLDKSLRINF